MSGTPRPGAAHPPVEGIGIVVPARDEAGTLPFALAALAAARENVEVPVDLVVVLDRCTDATPAVVSGADLDAVVIDAGNVGAARAAGFTRVVANRRGVRPEALWLATTDADSRVPPHWLSAQIRAANEGVDVLVGTVEPDADMPAPHRRAWAAQHRLVDGHPHVHGANLGMRASAYLAAGGFAPHAVHEDVDLVERLQALPDVVVRATDAHRVTTSSRRQGRTPGGFAGYLAALSELAPGSPVARE